jgi:hypothetical protein
MQLLLTAKFWVDGKDLETDRLIASGRYYDAEEMKNLFPDFKQRIPQKSEEIPVDLAYLNGDKTVCSLTLKSSVELNARVDVNCSHLPTKWIFPKGCTLTFTRIKDKMTFKSFRFCRCSKTCDTIRCQYDTLAPHAHQESKSDKEDCTCQWISGEMNQLPPRFQYND